MVTAQTLLSFVCILSVASSQLIAWTNLFFDDFNRASLGNNYIALQGLPLPSINANKLCGTTQSGAFVNLTLPNFEFVRVSYDFTSSTTAGFESYALATFNGIFSYAGCDGGYGSSNCFPVIANITNSFANGTVTPLTINVPYRMETIFSKTDGIQFNLYSIDMATQYATVQYNFAPGSFESFGVLVGRSGLSCVDNLLIETGSQSVVVSGCDGGGGTSQCTPRIFGATSSNTGSPVSMTIGSWYTMEVVIHEPSFSLTIKQGTTTLTSLTQNIPGKFYSQFGFLVGRNSDNSLTCADNFRIETSNDGISYTSVFFDDFNRGDGPLGASYPPINGIAQPSITSQKACGDVQSIGVYQGQIAAPYKRLSWIFQASNSEGFESYGVAVSNDSSLVPPASAGTDLIVILNANYSSIPDWNLFFVQYVQSLAAFLGIPPNRIQVLTVRSGSIIVNTRILGYPSSQSIAQNFVDYVVNNPLNPPVIAGFNVQSASLVLNGNSDGNPSIAWNVAFFDNFDRATLGSNYTGAQGIGLPSINNNRLCGTTQSIALFNVSTSIFDYVRISYDFIASTTDGFESYAVASNTNESIYLAGCDGGYNQRCGTTIRDLNSNGGGAQTIALAANTYYRFVIFFDNVAMRITFSILTGDLSTTLSTVSFNAAYGVRNPFGVLVGRSGLSCIDNLLVESGISSFLISGCDGGFGGGGLCTPTIAADNKAQQPGVNMNIFTPYNMEVIVHEPSITLSVKLGNTLLSSFTSTTTKFYNYYGLLVGRNADNQLTCADNFMIETSNDGTTYSTAFFDDFNRANGLPGSNYQVIPGVPAASITSNSLCADVQSLAIYSTPISAPYKRLTWTFNAADPSGFETYAVAINNQTSFFANNNGAAFVTVVLNGNISAVTNWGAFLAQYQNDVASQLGIPPSQVIILNVRSGSIIVETQINPSSPAANDASQLATALSSKISNGDIRSLGGYPAASATVVYSTTGFVTTGFVTTGVSEATSTSTSTTGGSDEGSSTADASKVLPLFALLAANFL